MCGFTLSPALTLYHGPHTEETHESRMANH
jgi:hypothetical protein